MAERYQDIQHPTRLTHMIRKRKGPRGAARPPTQIVMLGTGTPRPDPERSGPATAIVVNGMPYLVDFGPGVVRRAAAAYRKGVTGFGPAATELRTVFLTHLHADHTTGYPDLILTPWILGRTQPINVYGPTGLGRMTRHVMNAWKIDIDNRVNGIDRLPRAGCLVNVHEIEPGVIYTDRNIRVMAFPVRHGGLKDAFGFRFETPDKVVVISGDTAPTPTLADHCNGCDVLIHECYSQATYKRVSRKWQRYRRNYHTSSKELAALAARINPGLLVLYHRANAGGAMTLSDPEQILLDEVRRLYDGRVVTAHDLDIF
jgi:ribonuclease BN (tRNA processing enzyme)